MLDAVVTGLFEAAPLILAAMGFTLIYYLNGFINVAYAENPTKGAYFASLYHRLSIKVRVRYGSLRTGVRGRKLHPAPTGGRCDRDSATS